MARHTANGISAADRELVKRLSGRGGCPVVQSLNYVESWRQGNFTIVRVDATVGKLGRPKRIDHIGVAKRNCADDQDDPRRARDIAIARALRGEAQPVRE